MGDDRSSGGQLAGAPAGRLQVLAARVVVGLVCHTIQAGARTCVHDNCGSLGKHPLVRNGFHDPTTDLQTIRTWWGNWGADEFGDLTRWPGPEALAERLSHQHPNRGHQAIGTFVTYWRYFCIEMAPQDIVVTPLTGQRAGVARITGAYEYDGDDREPRLRHKRQVERLRSVERSDLQDEIRKVVNAPGTLCRIGAEGAAARPLI